MICTIILYTIYENTYYIFISSSELPVKEQKQAPETISNFIKAVIQFQHQREASSLEILSQFTELDEAGLKG